MMILRIILPRERISTRFDTEAGILVLYVFPDNFTYKEGLKL